MNGLEKKLTLYGFNNLTKTLSFNIYDVCYAKTEREQTDYIAYIDEQYNSERLTKILCDVTEMIGAKILNISKQGLRSAGRVGQRPDRGKGFGGRRYRSLLQPGKNGARASG